MINTLISGINRRLRKTNKKCKIKTRKSIERIMINGMMRKKRLIGLDLWQWSNKILWSNIHGEIGKSINVSKKCKNTLKAIKTTLKSKVLTKE